MAKKRTDLKIPYGVSDFRTIRNEGLYYVDKTEYFAQMEARDRFIFFVRPRRFGKSLFISMMESYYDLNQKKDFKKLFGDLWIGSLFFYHGLLSMAGRKMGETVFAVPNACVEKQIYSYLRDRYFPPSKSFLDWDAAAQAFAYEGKWQEFFDLVSKNFAETTPIRGGIDGEVRMQGYFQCEMGHLPQFITCPDLEMSHGNCDFFLFPERHYYGDVPHSYLVGEKRYK